VMGATNCILVWGFSTIENCVFWCGVVFWRVFKNICSLCCFWCVFFCIFFGNVYLYMLFKLWNLFTV